MSNPTKVLVRKGANQVNQGVHMRPNSFQKNSFMQNPPPAKFDYRSVQQREEDYNRARNRIFLQNQEAAQEAIQQQNSADNGSIPQPQFQPGVPPNMGYLAAAAAPHSPLIQPQLQGQLNTPTQSQDTFQKHQQQQILEQQDGRYSQENLQAPGLEDEPLDGLAKQDDFTGANDSSNSVTNISQNQNQQSQSQNASGGNLVAQGRRPRKAVFKNKEQELQDPDYRRGIERFQPRFANFDEQQKQGYYFMPTYGSEFPALNQNPQGFMMQYPYFMPQQGQMNPQMQGPVYNQQGQPMQPQMQGYGPQPQIQQMHNPQQMAQQPQQPMQQPQYIPFGNSMPMYQPIQGPSNQQQNFPQQPYMQPFPMYPQMSNGRSHSGNLPQMQPRFQQQHMQQMPPADSQHQQFPPQMPNPPGNAQMAPHMFPYPQHLVQGPPNQMNMFVNPQQQMPVDLNVPPHLQQHPSQNQLMIGQQQPVSNNGSINGRNSNRGSSHRSSVKNNNQTNQLPYQQQQLQQQQQFVPQQQQPLFQQLNSQQGQQIAQNGKALQQGNHLGVRYDSAQSKNGGFKQIDGRKNMHEQAGAQSQYQQINAQEGLQ